MGKTLFETEIDDLYVNEEITLNPYHKAASMVFKRKERFVEGYSNKKEMIRLCNLFFGDKGLIENSGLNKQFTAMREYVKEKELIGLVFCGINENDILIQNYTTQTFSKIKLTVGSITRTLLRKNFSKDEVDMLCKNTPNFNIYYSDSA